MNKELATNPSPCIRRMTVLFLTGNLKKKNDVGCSNNNIYP